MTIIVSVIAAGGSFQSLIDRARLTLNDDDKVRYPDASMMTFANLAMGEIRRVRPDLFFGSYENPNPVYLLTDTYPLAPEYEVCMVDYLVARSQAKDQEFGDNSRVAAFFNMHVGALTKS